jgi:hypothetical protein
MQKRKERDYMARMPTGSTTTEDITRIIEELKESTRQERIARGLSPEPKRIEPFVSIPLAMAIMDRMQPFVRIAIKYAALLADGVAHKVDTDKFAEYREYAQLLDFTSATMCRWAGAGGVNSMLRIMDSVNDSAYEDVHLPKLLRDAHFAIDMMRDRTDGDVYNYRIKSPEESQAHIRANWAEYKRLRTDSDAFDTALDEARHQYDLIKGDIDNYECE